MKITHAAVALTALTALALTGCAKTELVAPAAAKATSVAPSPTTSDAGNFQTPDPADLAVPSQTPGTEDVSDAPADDTLTDETAAPDSVRFGETWTWEDGVTVTVSKPAKFKPSYTAMGGDGFKQHVQFTITIKNGSKEKLELFGTPTIMSGDTEGDAVFDTAKGLNGAPDSKVLPGRTAKFKVGYGVTNTTDLVLEYEPTFSHEGATFTSK